MKTYNLAGSNIAQLFDFNQVYCQSVIRDEYRFFVKYNSKWEENYIFLDFASSKHVLHEFKDFLRSFCDDLTSSKCIPSLFHFWWVTCYIRMMSPFKNNWILSTKPIKLSFHKHKSFISDLQKFMTYEGIKCLTWNMGYLLDRIIFLVRLS